MVGTTQCGGGWGLVMEKAWRSMMGTILAVGLVMIAHERHGVVNWGAGAVAGGRSPFADRVVVSCS